MKRVECRGYNSRRVKLCGSALECIKDLDAFCLFEAERLVVELVTISRRVLGPDHRITIQAVDLR